jgi:hypothetical protein
MNQTMKAHQPASAPSELQVLFVTLDFACCSCRGPVGVTLRCEGPDLSGAAGSSVAAVGIPCPHCGKVNELLFEPRGRVRDVRPWPGRPAIPTPSLN